jgi:MurNAc alpha-1-phosphate uridylyltransferase
MRAMILAAGRGERLRPLTDSLPKPLVPVAGKPLIEYHLEALAQAGFREIVINQGHLGDLLKERVGKGGRWGVNIHWSDEQPEALETGGGIFKALPLLGKGPFLVVNGDIWCTYAFARLRAVKCDHAHLVMVPNPEHNPQGDFALHGAVLKENGGPKLTFSGIGVYHPRLFRDCSPGKFPLAPILQRAMDSHIVTGERFNGPWNDAGTMQRLAEIEGAI